MAKGIPQSRAALEQSLEEQIGFLEKSAALYDAGDRSEAKRLAGTLRILLHETKRSHSLLKQLGFDVLQFYDSAGDLDQHNLLTQCPLLIMPIGGGDQDYLPLLDGGPFPAQARPFAVWWNQSVFVDDAQKTFARRDIVLSVADQDGGSHVDPELEPGYHRLSNENSLAWIIGSPTGRRPARNPVPAALRQITYETLKSLAPLRVKLV